MSQFLYLLRHANADTEAVRDEDRALSLFGEQQSCEVAKFCAAQAIKPALILTSPLRRAFETAQIVARHLEIGCEIAPWLASGMKSSTALENLTAHRDQEPLMIVGHEPDFSSLAASLLGLPAGRSIHLGKASLTLLEHHGQARSATLHFSLPWKMM